MKITQLTMCNTRDINKFASWASIAVQCGKDVLQHNGKDLPREVGPVACASRALLHLSEVFRLNPFLKCFTTNV